MTLTKIRNFLTGLFIKVPNIEFDVNQSRGSRDGRTDRLTYRRKEMTKVIEALFLDYKRRDIKAGGKNVTINSNSSFETAVLVHKRTRTTHLTAVILSKYATRLPRVVRTAAIYFQPQYFVSSLIPQSV